MPIFELKSGPRYPSLGQTILNIENIGVTEIRISGDRRPEQVHINTENIGRGRDRDSNFRRPEL